MEDFNLDGFQDIIGIASSCSEGNALYMGNAQGEFVLVPDSPMHLQLDGTSAQVIAGDIDGDGDTDVMIFFNVGQQILLLNQTN